MGCLSLIPWPFRRTARTLRPDQTANETMTRVNELQAVQETLTRESESFQGVRPPAVVASAEPATVRDNAYPPRNDANQRDEDLDIPCVDGRDEPTHGQENPKETQTSLSSSSNVHGAVDPAPEGSADPRDPSSSEKGKSGDVLKACLGRIDFVLSVLEDVSGLVPVAGFAEVVPVARLIVEQFRNTVENSDTAAELAEDIFHILNMIDGTVKNVQSNIKSMENALGGGQIAVLDLGRFASPVIFDKMVMELKIDLERVLQVTQEARKGGFFTRLFSNNEVKSRLDDAKKILEQAKSRFQEKQTILVTLTVHAIHATVTRISSTIESMKQDDDLAKLGHVSSAGHEAFSDPGLLPGTRTHLIKKITDWKNKLHLAATNKILVLSGAAGTGKTTISREVCSILQAENKLGASFFFRSGTEDRGSTAKVVLTIAFQLANSQYGYRPHIANAAREYSKSPSGKLEEQLQKLIIRPVKRAQTQNPCLAEIPVVIVLDALDEAGEDLSSFLKQLKVLIDAECNFCIFVTTRPESSVEYAFSKSGIDAFKTRGKMEDAPRGEVDEDIERLLRQRFDDLRWREDLLAAHPDLIKVLVKKAERLFIYIRTVVDYLDHRIKEVSLQRLKIILSGSGDKVGLPALDKLYATILNNVYDQEALGVDEIRTRVRAFLAGLVLLRKEMTVELLAPLMDLREDEVIATVDELRSILSCTGQDPRKAIIRPLHLTFKEYLLSGKQHTDSAFYVDRRSGHLTLAKACLRTMNAELRRNICELNDPCAFRREIEDLRALTGKHVRKHVRYACEHWSIHLVESEPTDDPSLLQSLEEFCKNQLLHWIEVQCLLGSLEHVQSSLERACFWAKDHVDFAQLSSILSDAWQFVAMFYDAIDWCPGHIYTCALSLAPICSLVKLYAHKDDSSCLISPREPKWDCPYALSGFADVATFSCDGALLILSMWDKMEIRDAATGRLLRTLEDAKRIVSADVHPSNHSFVTISTNGLVQEWGLSGDAGLLWTGEFPGARKSFVWWLWNGSKVVYNADGTKIVCYSDGVDSIHVWPTGGCLPLSTRLVMPPATTVETLSSDCGREHVVALLITKGKPAVVKFWNIDTGEEIKSLQIKSDEIESAVFAKRSTMLVTSHQTKICMWDLEGDCFTHTMTIPSPSHARYTMKPLKSYVPKKRFAWPVAVSPSGGVIAAGCRDDAIRFYDAEAGALPAVYRGHYLITSLHFSPQGDRLVSSSEGDKTTRVWDTTKEALSSDLSSDCCFTRIVFSPNGKYIAAIAKADTRVLVYSGQTGICLTTLTRHTDHVMALAFSLDGSILATISKDGLICLWDMGVDTALPSTPSQSWTIESIKSVDMAFNASGNLLAIVCVVDDLSFVVAVHEISDRDWAGNGVESFRSKPSNGNPPHLIRFEPDEPLVRVRYVDPDVNVRIWDRMNDSVEECAYDESVHSTWVFPYEIDGKWGWGKREEWIVSNRDKRRLLWLPEHRKPLEHCMDVHGDRLAIGSKEGILTLVDMSRLKGDQL